jgi:tetratricopeptide (TPR) repeat protein
LCTLASASARAQSTPPSAQRGERPELAYAPADEPAQGASTNDRTRARELTAKASAAYRANDFAQALEHFERAYALVPAPELLFNVGQCQRHLGRDAQARGSFRAYLRARPNAPERAQIERWIASAGPEPERQPVARREPPPVAAREPTPAPGRLAPSAAQLPVTPVPAIDDPVVDHTLVEGPDMSDPTGEIARSERDDQGSVVERWWFWAAVGVAVGGGITATLLLSDEEEPSPGSLGTVRWD